MTQPLPVIGDGIMTEKEVFVCDCWCYLCSLVIVGESLARGRDLATAVEITTLREEHPSELSAATWLWLIDESTWVH